jgi:sarcosine oxidase, subunit gamma
MVAHGVAPTDFLRRSFCWRKLVEAGARFEELNGAAVAMRYANATDEDDTARRLGLADLSPLPRVGFKGKGTADWLASQGLTLPTEPNRTAAQSDGSLALRLAQEEIFLLGNLKGEAGLGRTLHDGWVAAGTPPASARGFLLPRAETHAWFLVTGENAAEMLAKLCGVDLRPAKFENGRIAQTSAAKMSVVIARADQGATLAYHLVADSASAEYLWNCLIDAMAEFNGGPVGLKAMQGLAA